MTTITNQNDVLTNELLEFIRNYESEYDTNVDVTIKYGHYSNRMTFNYYDTEKSIDIEKSEIHTFASDYTEYKCMILEILVDMLNKSKQY